MAGRRLPVITVLLGLLVLPPPAATAGARDPASFKVGIQPLGSYREVDARVVRQALRDVYGFDVRILEPLAMPPVAYYKPRNRHRADRLLAVLDGLRQEAARACELVVGLTRQDISTTKGDVKDWGIFGLGQIHGTACVVSAYRLIRGLGKKEADKGLRRVVKVAIHEVGHVLGLHHCPTPGCVMNDAEGTVKTVDRETGLLCPACQRFLRARFAFPEGHSFDMRWEAWLGSP
ncbi:MAG: matrixin family metalloprotease [Deltaproteobacteria bacterium]|nr:matrixin family metalloprotease [Deltaproteobacteria bacterium]